MKTLRAAASVLNLSLRSSPSVFDKERPPQRSRRAHLTANLCRQLLDRSVDHTITWVRERQQLIALKSPDMLRCSFEWHKHGGAPCLYVEPKPAPSSDRTVVYYHGGGYAIGSVEGYRNTLATLAVLTGARVIGVDYRLAPEHRFPKAHDDALRAAHSIIEEAQGPVILAGDSAGAALCIDVAQQLHALDDDHKPHALALISPWVKPSECLNNDEDAPQDVLSPALLKKWLLSYVDETEASDPRMQFVDSDLSFMPSTMVQYAGSELFRPQIEAFIRQAQQCDCWLKVSCVEDQFHVFQTFWPMVPEAEPALKELAQFISEVN